MWLSDPNNSPSSVYTLCHSRRRNLVLNLISKLWVRKVKNEKSTTETTQCGDVNCNVKSGRQSVEYKGIILTAGVKFVRRRHIINTCTYIISFLCVFISFVSLQSKADRLLHCLSYKRSSTNRNFCIFVARKHYDYRTFIQYFLIYNTKFSGNRKTALRQLIRFHCL